MLLDFSKLKLDKNGIPENPVLILQTLSEDSIGAIPGVHNLKPVIKFSEPSEIEFDVPAAIDGEPNPIYKELTGHRLIYTKQLGVYMTLNPTTEGDGIEEIKHIKAYSREKTLDSKRFFLEEGTFKFYEATNPNDPDTIVGRILEVAVGWKVGHVDPSIAQKYRTFTQYDDFLLQFIYNTIPQKIRS